MNESEISRLFAKHDTPRLSVGFGFMVIAIAVELSFAIMMAYGGYSNELAVGIGISYSVAAIASIVGGFPFVRSVVGPIRTSLICLVAPLVIQFLFVTKFIYFLVRLPFLIFRAFIRKKPKPRRKAPTPKPNRLEKLVHLRVGNTVTFTPPGEGAVIGVIKRINAKSTTVVDQTGVTWRVPHDESERIIRSKAAPKVKNIRQLELVR